MLDAFRNITSGKSKHVQKQTDELQLLITAAREERSALSTMLTTLTAREREADAARQVARRGDGEGGRRRIEARRAVEEESTRSTIARGSSTRSTSAFRP